MTKIIDPISGLTDLGGVMGKLFERFGLVLIPIGMILVGFTQTRNGEAFQVMLPTILGLLGLLLLSASWLLLMLSKLWKIQELGYSLKCDSRGEYTVQKPGHAPHSGLLSFSEALEVAEEQEKRECMLKEVLSERGFSQTGSSSEA